MRRLLTLLLCILAFNLSAQHFGARIGLNFTGANYDLSGVDLETGRETNLMLGIFFDTPLLGDLITIQPELNYLNRGYDIDEAVNNLVYDEQTVSYIDLGAILKVNLPLGPAGLYVGAGPHYSYAISGQQSLVNGGDEDIDFDAERINRSGLQVTGLGGVTFGVGLKFFAELRYNATVTNYSDDETREISPNYFGISGGVMVPLGG